MPIQTFEHNKQDSVIAYDSISLKKLQLDKLIRVIGEFEFCTVPSHRRTNLQSNSKAMGKTSIRKKIVCKTARNVPERCIKLFLIIVLARKLQRVEIVNERYIMSVC